ncbi:MAG TPA: universal stress protein [Gaiellaceae bacterium]|nr:universal stress protein [Gaiellaceae bacterium]
MHGTILCAVTDSQAGRSAARMAAVLAERLGLRLVLAHVVDGMPRGGGESLTARQGRAGAEQRLTELATELKLADDADLRVEVGDRAAVLAQLAAEEGADLVVLGSELRGVRGRNLRCGLARDLEATTAAPVLVAPPQTVRRSERRLAAAEAAG